MADKLIKVDVAVQGLDRFQNAVAKLLRIDSKVAMMLTAIGYEVQADAIEMIQKGPARTGVEYTRGGKNARRSADGEPAKSDTGNLASSVFVQVLGTEGVQVGYLDAMAHYGEFLEDPNKLNRQVLEPSAKNNAGFIEAQKNKLAQEITKDLLS